MNDREPLLAQDPTGDVLALPATEDLDWGYARTKRCVLMVPAAEWVQSIYSCTFTLNGKKFITPNRDCPYEGLTVHQDGESWKFIDCIALALRHQDGTSIPFVVGDASPSVQITPWRATYCYKTLGTRDDETAQSFFVSYYLNSNNTPKLATGCIELYFPDGLVHAGGGIEPIIQPFVDVRHMYESSDSVDGYHRWDETRGGRKQIHVTHYNRRLTFYVSYVETDFFREPEILDWGYKLGECKRTERPAPDGRGTETAFVEIKRKVASFFQFRVPVDSGQSLIRLYWGCGLHDEPAHYVFSHVEKLFKGSRQNDQEQLRQVQAACPLPDDLKLRSAIWARIVGLRKFKLYIQRPGAPVRLTPPAGGWWFRTPWYRDVFEGLLNNLETLLRFPEEKTTIQDAIRLAVHDQDQHTGSIPRGIPEYKHLGLPYDSSDGTLLCFIVANAYIDKTGDVEFALELLPHAWTTIRCFNEDNAAPVPSFQEDGPPRVDTESGLLLSAPRHSWLDTRHQEMTYRGQTISELPSRFSAQFLQDLFDHLYDQTPDTGRLKVLLFSPNFFLPEIDAQWITLLKGTLKTIALVAGHTATTRITDLQGRAVDLQTARAIIQGLLERATGSFQRIFWNDEKGFLFNTLYADGIVRDPLECEAGITAAAMLGEAAFTRQQLEASWECARDKLLIHRRLVEYGDQTLPFGLIARNVGPSLYYGDPQYHGDVTWPRSTPYLIRLLRLLHHDDIVEQLLINALDHQMSEAAIFFSQELFSRPLGHNPHPDERTCDNPVPVKNPIQFWSQWCDAFIEFFGERKS